MKNDTKVAGKKTLKKRLRRFLPMYIMALPGLIYLFVNNYMPLPGLVLAFKKFNAKKGMFGSDFIGLKNFEPLFKTKDAFVITRNTILYNLAFIVIQFDTTHVTDMSKMFQNCRLINTVEISSFNTENVENMSKMFDGCKKLNKLEFSHILGNKLKNISAIFRGCETLKSLNLGFLHFSLILFF